jgi:hypothetical protein
LITFVQRHLSFSGAPYKRLAMGSSIEDVQYLMQNSTEESYLYNVNSSIRDKSIWPYPNQYAIRFDSPFKQVIGIDVVDATIPRTQYTVDSVNNSLVFDVGNGPVTVQIETGDRTDKSLIAALNKELAIKGITALSDSNPSELRNMIKLTSPLPFHLLMGSSTIRPVLGFDEDAAKHEFLNRRFRCSDLVLWPATFSSVTENEVQALAFEGPQAIEFVVPFADSDRSTAQYIAQKFVATQTGILSEVRVACAISSKADNRVIEWYITSSNAVQNQPATIISTGMQIPAEDFPSSNQIYSNFSTSGDLSSIGRCRILVSFPLHCYDRYFGVVLRVSGYC